MIGEGDWEGEVPQPMDFDPQDPLGVESGEKVELDPAKQAQDLAFLEQLKVTFGKGTPGREVLEHLKGYVFDTSVLEARGLGCPVGLPPALLMAFREGQRSVLRAICEMCDTELRKEAEDAGRTE